MQDIGDKSDSTAGATGELTAAEYNNHKNELQGAVEKTGQTLSAATFFQLAKALFINGIGAQSVVDGGTANSVLLSPFTGASGLTPPDNYAEFNGGILQFVKSTPNTSTAVTVNFGPNGTELGAKSLVRPDGTVPSTGDVSGRCTIQWDNSADKWVLLSNGANAFTDTVSVTGTFTPQNEMNHRVIIDTTLGAVTVTIADGTFDGQRLNVHCIDAGTANGFYKGTGIYDGAGATGTYISPGFDIWLEWSETEGRWTYEDVLTSKWINGDWIIYQYSNGELVEIIDGRKNNGVVAGQFYTYPVPYSGSAPSARQCQNSASFATDTRLTVLQTNGIEIVVVDATGAAVSAVRDFEAVIDKGVY